ncbi:MAG: hypothetical protein AAGA48_35960 [Myxococcota bacterium]
MPMIRFHNWSHPPLLDSVAYTTGRPRASLRFTMTERSADGVANDLPAEIVVDLASVDDVQSLEAGAVTRRFPAPGVRDAERTRLALVEFDDPALPWLYSPEPATDGRKRPWLVLVVGQHATEEDRADLSLHLDADPVEVTLEPAFLATLPLTDSHAWAHVQDLEGDRLARLLAPRRLEAHTDYTAVLVPAFVREGEAVVDAWSASSTESVRLPAYAHWRFRTGEDDDFLALAQALEPQVAPPYLGRTALRYPRQPLAPRLSAPGALAAQTPLPAPDAEDPWPIVEALPATVADDLAELRSFASSGRDERGRPIVTLPHYGEPWSTTDLWSTELNADPRHRGAAGLGAELGIADQDRLVDLTMQAMGPVREAQQRVRHLALGVSAARSLWNRHLPATRAERVLLLGTAMPRIMTEQGPLADVATGSTRSLSRALFSSAARRVLRRGPPRAERASPNAHRKEDLLEAANACPVPPPDPRGLMVVEPDPLDVDRSLDATAVLGHLDPALGRTPQDAEALSRLRTALEEATGGGSGTPVTAGTSPVFDSQRVSIVVQLPPLSGPGGGPLAGGGLELPRFATADVTLSTRSDASEDELEIMVIAAGIVGWRLSIDVAGTLLSMSESTGGSLRYRLPSRPPERGVNVIVELDGDEVQAPGRDSVWLQLGTHFVEATLTPNTWTPDRLRASLQLDITNPSERALRAATVEVGGTSIPLAVDVPAGATTQVTQPVDLPADTTGTSPTVVVEGRATGVLQVPRPAGGTVSFSTTPWLVPFVLATRSAPGRSGEAERIWGQLRPWAENATADDLDTWGENLQGTPWEGLDAVTVRALGQALRDRPRPPVSPHPPCAPVDLARLDEVLVQAFDPTGPNYRVIDRVNRTLPGRDPDAGIEPIGVCPDVPLPVWELLRARRADWLLPGLASLTPHAVVALRTDRAFVESLLVGINQQLLAELKWRGLPITPGCSPLRRFWGRVDPETGETLYDVEPLGKWANTPLADASHQPGDGRASLVVVLRTELFRRYPATLTYLLPAGPDPQNPDFSDPDSHAGLARSYPIFQGAIGDDVVFFGFDVSPEEAAGHWFVLEEPSRGFRFWSVQDDQERLAEALAGVDRGDSGAHVAANTFANPVRVMLRGDRLVSEGGS